MLHSVTFQAFTDAMHTVSHGVLWPALHPHTSWPPRPHLCVGTSTGDPWVDSCHALPSTVWDMIGHELSRWGCQKCLGLVTEVAAFHILSNIMSHTRPPVVAL